VHLQSVDQPVNGQVGCAGRGSDDTMCRMTAAPTPSRTVDPAHDEDVTGDVPWQAVVWNDPVNLMSYVTYVLQKLFGYPEPKATALMLDVHHKGKAAVSSGDKEKVEGDVAKLHAAGLWATMQRV
jgi:ATP-dependent Clp protease adaptor protein ClpS